MEIKSTGVLGNLGNPLDLAVFEALGDRYRRYTHQGCLKISGNITACMYRTGKAQIYGIKQLDSIDAVWHEFLEILRPYTDISHADAAPELKFIVAAEKLPYPVNLRALSVQYPDERIEYEPEQFPALFWKLEGGTCLLFSSGSMIVSGCRTESDIYRIIQTVRKKTES